MKFFDDTIQIAQAADLPEILQILNKAYRGEESLKGWTSEMHLIDGEVRTTLPILNALYEQSNSVFLVCKTQGKVVGTVNLQNQGNRLYLGMLAVLPNLQNAGIGKKLLAAADEWANFQQCESIYMTVILERFELISWYMRHGYHNTGKTEPFEEDGIHGRHLKKLEFSVLEKTLNL